MNGIYAGHRPNFAGGSLKRKLAGGAVGAALLATAACSAGGSGGSTKTSESPSSPPVSSATDTPGQPSATTKPSTQLPSPSHPFTPPVSPGNPMPSYSALPIYPKGTVTDKATLRQTIQDMDATVNSIEGDWHTIDLNKMEFKKRVMQEAVVQMKDSRKELHYQITDDEVKHITVKDEQGKLAYQLAINKYGNYYYRKADGANLLIHQDFVKKRGLNPEFQQLTMDVKKLMQTLQNYLHI